MAQASVILRIAFGPALPGNGSWEWNGADLSHALSEVYETVTFENEIPACDLLVVIKFPLSADAIRVAASKVAVIFAPVDFYGSCAEIDNDWRFFRQCARIVVHSPRLAKYFRSYVVRFLRQAGYDVRHLYAVFSGWEMGRVTEDLPGDHRPLVFDDASWNADGIRRRFREALDEYRPDWVVITDSWNSKPLLAEAARGYRYVLRLAAQELLCPLNNVRLLMDGAGRFCACPRHQLATPEVCRACVQTHERSSGDCIGPSARS